MQIILMLNNNVLKDGILPADRARRPQACSEIEKISGGRSISLKPDQDQQQLTYKYYIRISLGVIFIKTKTVTIPVIPSTPKAF